MRPTSRDQFEVAIICALTLEADAVEALFDETYDKFGQLYGKQSGDKNAYITGRIGRHNVVLCYLPGMGIGSAAGVAANLHVSYTHIELALVVGICGAVPFPFTNTEIILGDIIIGDSVIQYDFGRQYPDGFRRKTDVKETLGRPNQEIRAFLTGLNGLRTRRELQDRIYEHLQSLQSQAETVWQRPDIVHDVLFEAFYHHKHRRHNLITKCICFEDTSSHASVCDEAMQKDCESLGCAGNVVDRRRCGVEATKPLIHIGPIASASTVMKSGKHRDRIAEKEGVIGFEMEGAGVWDNGPCIIIKGVCDYADSHKNKLWQNYAAATAASCTKSFLEYWMPKACEIPVRLSDSSHRHKKFLRGENKVNLVSCTRKRELNLENDQENHEVKRRARIYEQLRCRPVNSTSLPLQVQWTDLVVLNDALGETYYFSRNLIDSFELFVTVIKRKFEHVGLGKIERNEWKLQDHHTGHILNVNRHWKAIIKSGQTLDMSMIFRRPKLLSIVCPWCNTENECTLDEQHVECQKCFRRYRRVEELNEISVQPASSSSSVSQEESQPKEKKKEDKKQEFPAICPMPLQQVSKVDGDDINLYTRVQMVDVHFRLIQEASDNAPEHLVKISRQHLEDIEHFVQYLAKSSGLSKEDCLSALKDGYGEFLAKIAAGYYRLTTTMANTPQMNGKYGLTPQQQMLREYQQQQTLATQQGQMNDQFTPQQLAQLQASAHAQQNKHSQQQMLQAQQNQQQQQQLPQQQQDMPNMQHKLAYQAQLMRAHFSQMQMVKQQQDKMPQGQMSQCQQNQHQDSPQMITQKQQILMASARANGWQIPNMKGANDIGQRYNRLVQQRLLHLRHEMSQRFMTQYGPPRQYPPHIAQQYGAGLEKVAKAWVQDLMRREQEATQYQQATQATMQAQQM